MREFQQTSSNSQNPWPAITRVINIATDVRKVFELMIQEVLSANQIIILKTHESVGVTFPETDEENRSVLDRSRDGSIRKKESDSLSV